MRTSACIVKVKIKSNFNNFIKNDQCLSFVNFYAIKVCLFCPIKSKRFPKETNNQQEQKQIPEYLSDIKSSLFQPNL